MKTCRKELWFEVPARRALINITPKVEALSGSRRPYLHADSRVWTPQAKPLGPYRTLRWGNIPHLKSRQAGHTLAVSFMAKGRADTKCPPAGRKQYDILVVRNNRNQDRVPLDEPRGFSRLGEQ